MTNPNRKKRTKVYQVRKEEIKRVQGKISSITNSGPVELPPNSRALLQKIDKLAYLNIVLV